jgi:glutathione S-transferase
MLRLHDFLESGNGYRCACCSTSSEFPFERVEARHHEGATRTAAFLAKNPN